VVRFCHAFANEKRAGLNPPPPRSSPMSRAMVQPNAAAATPSEIVQRNCGDLRCPPTKGEPAVRATQVRRHAATRRGASGATAERRRVPLRPDRLAADLLAGGPTSARFPRKAGKLPATVRCPAANESETAAPSHPAPARRGKATTYSVRHQCV
jgi:hypothetical protein